MLVAAMAALPFTAKATVVLNTDLPTTGFTGPGIAVTTTTPGYGTVTTVNGPGADRASAPVTPGIWSQRNVGGEASVGITTDYARDGNGSAYFKGTSGASKADLELFLSQTRSLSNLSELTYEWYRDSGSTVPAHLHPTLRLIVGNNANATLATVGGYLVYEGIYQDPPIGTADTGTWVFESVLGANVWGTGNLPGAFAVYDRNFEAWDLTVDDLHVYGISIGFGSGWNGEFEGAIDNVSIAFGDSFNDSWNFEVAVPAPSALLLFGTGLIAFGALRGRCRAA